MIHADKKAEIIILKILGAGIGATGFFVLALVPGTTGLLIGTALIGIGSLVLTAGGLT